MRLIKKARNSIKSGIKQIIVLSKLLRRALAGIKQD